MTFKGAKCTIERLLCIIYWLNLNLLPVNTLINVYLCTLLFLISEHFHNSFLSVSCHLLPDGSFNKKHPVSQASSVNVHTGP